MYGAIREELRKNLDEIRAAGLYKPEHVIGSPQSARVTLADGRTVLNMCANNYLGLADDPGLIEAAKRGLDEWGFGMASVRFICGTQTIHTELEGRISRFLGTESTILYGSCFDANGGLFETLLGPDDAIISDALNHASIIDGVRLSKARRLRYANADMAELEARLREAEDARYRLIATDGVFSMDGYLAPLDRICDLADEYDALVMVDDSHAVGFIGPHGAGTPEHFGVTDRVDIVTGTLGKALGGASGGYTSGRAEIVEYLRQRSRPYLFSNSVAPSIVTAATAVLERLDSGAELRERLRENTAFFRSALTAQGFDVLPGEHPIVPVMIGDASRAARLSERLFAEGVYAVSFSYPVVPHGAARIRTQVSAAHTIDDLREAAEAFVRARAAVD
ncbi:glycine C-acetyltransferase [Jiangella asiatica]|uniref:2-amino-3-ketobutyrate coenzyme A ligase n=1 Tax=Jiangella asiatica TaxID=2530372 RepID=A0A4R5CGU7_9ACTN|nr:glycine C-acetyltransferase [Jiangella asiatica]TDD98935.1 glycine C-acetyltransferase [Jiangella asiatica]